MITGQRQDPWQGHGHGVLQRRPAVHLRGAHRVPQPAVDQQGVPPPRQPQPALALGDEDPVEHIVPHPGVRPPGLGPPEVEGRARVVLNPDLGRPGRARPVLDRDGDQTRRRRPGEGRGVGPGRLMGRRDGRREFVLAGREVQQVHRRDEVHAAPEPIAPADDQGGVGHRDPIDGDDGGRLFHPSGRRARTGIHGAVCTEPALGERSSGPASQPAPSRPRLDTSMPTGRRSITPPGLERDGFGGRLSDGGATLPPPAARRAVRLRTR